MLAIVCASMFRNVFAIMFSIVSYSYVCNCVLAIIFIRMIAAVLATMFVLVSAIAFAIILPTSSVTMRLQSLHTI